MSDAYHTGPGTPGKHPGRGRGAACEADIGVRRHPGRRLVGIGLVAGLLPIVLGSCGNVRSVASDATQIEDFRAGVVADEPRAALIGRTAIANGGNAADGVVAAYFAMSVSLPGTAGLGGGGICIAHDAEERITEVIDFLPRAAAGGRVAVPGNVRGMAALNARYGRLQFAALVGPAEVLATGGLPVSKALTSDLQQYGHLLSQDPKIHNVFHRLDGAMLGDGDNLRQTELGASLGQIRAQGVNAFYSGLLGQKLAENAQAIGAPLTIDDLRNYKVAIYPPLETKFLDISLYVTPPPASGGVLTAQALEMLSGGDNSPARQMEISRQLMAARSVWMQPDGSSSVPPADLVLAERARALAAQATAPLPVEEPTAASVVAVDSDGFAVACAFTMNAPFGAARMAGDTGIILAPAPSDQGVGFSALSPVMAASKFNGQLYFASAAAGGAPGALAEALVLDAVMRRALPLDQAMQLPRAFDGGGQSVDESGGLRLGRLNAIFCSRGTPSSPDTCQLRNDYRGNGLATILGED
ncbi:MAG: gamma-glutamyltransferase [Rhodospirillaceae bacterium]|nr:gamma-glutamyltransferase [Rhodospirillaceae bacterium]